ncbi:MAG: septum formation initiator family protein [Deltaproteobacteria bacterium]|nr:septum formation initiator family protein [Deltaproteobacteria bacterium]
MLKPKALITTCIIGVVLFSMMLVIVYGDHGLRDLLLLRQEHDRLAVENERVFQQNISLHRRMERLKNDPGYIEAVARKELGGVSKNEIIIKMKSSMNGKK